MTDRLVDYFIVVGCGETLKPLKSTSFTLSNYYQATVTDRYPLQDYADSPLPDSMAMFCIPDGIKLTPSPELPIFYNFANTVANGARLYGSCLRFFEPVSKEMIEQLNNELESPRRNSVSNSLTRPDSTPPLNSARGGILPKKTSNSSKQIIESGAQLYAAKCICILSHWPFLDSFRTFLTCLYRASLTPTHICIESYLNNLMFEVPLPPPGKIQVQYHINGTQIFFKRPPPNNPLAFVDFNLSWIFRKLNAEFIVKVVECLLLERQVLIISSHYSMLTVAAESFLSLLYPFVWQYVYIPFLPQAAIDFINAPLPFLVGTHSSFIDKAQVAESICLVDLDSNTLRLPILPHSNMATAEHAHISLPERERLKLTDKLFELIPPVGTIANNISADIDLAFPNAAPPEEADDVVENKPLPCFEIRYTFFRCFLSIFKNYREFILQPSKTGNNSELFNTSEFIRKNPASERFLQAFCQSMAFQKFVEDRVYVTPETESDVFYFDQSILAKLNRSFFSRHNDTPFLTDPSFEISKTFIAMAPDTSYQHESSFTYIRWPQLDFDLFYPSRLTLSPFQSDQIRSHNAVLSYKKSNLAGSISNAHLNAKQSLSRNMSEQTIYFLWFYLYGASLRKSASLYELIPAYDIYCRMRAEGFVVDDNTYKIILESCGKVGTPDLAFYILKDMKLAGIIPDASVYNSIISTLDNNNHAVGDQNIAITHLAETVRKSIFSMQPLNPADVLGQAYTPATPHAGGSSPSSNPYSPQVQSPYVNHLNVFSFNFYFPSQTEMVADTNLFFSVYSEENKLAPRKSLGMPATVQTDYFVSIFEIAFPKLTIITTDYCMDCSKPVLDHEIRASWTTDSNDYTTQCPYCSCRFVARFSIKPKGVEDESKVISCEYLSPLVLRKEVENILARESPDFLLSKEFRKNSVTCFWNLAWHLSNLQLPMEGILIPVLTLQQALYPELHHRDSFVSDSQYLNPTMIQMQ